MLPDLRSVLPAVLFDAAAPADDADDGRAAFDALLATIPAACATRAATDDLASEIVCKGARHHRRALVRALVSPPRRAEALPFVARLAAILAACYKHVGSEVSAAVLDDLTASLPCISSARDLAAATHLAAHAGELVKFKLVAPAAAFGVLKTALDASAAAGGSGGGSGGGADAGRHPHVIVACELLERCGRYLYRNPATQAR